MPRHARVPIEVLSDPELSHADVRVYAAMAVFCFKGGNIVKSGQRQLAATCQVDRRTIRRSLENLAKRGHISSAIVKTGARANYQLNSPVFMPHYTGGR